jgi:hypothetical protein
LLDHFEELGFGGAARAALADHLERFGSPGPLSFVFHADYVVSVLRRSNSRS